MNAILYLPKKRDSIFTIVEEKKSVINQGGRGMNKPITPLYSQELEILRRRKERERRRELRGEGISYNQIKKFLETVPKVTSTASDLVFGKVGTTISNKLHENYNKNPEWKPKFSGEKHLILPTKYGLTQANWAGPGTKIEKRLNRGDSYVDGEKGIDKAAKKHDLKYTIAKTKEDIRKADEEFIKDVENSDQNSVVKNIVKNAIKAKNIGEDLGVVKPSLFAPQIGKGKGKGKKYLPGQKLKEKILADLDKENKQNHNKLIIDFISEKIENPKTVSRKRKKK